MEAAATHTSFEPNPWVTSVSIEDDDGNIHELELPEGICRDREFIERFLARVRPQPVRVEPQPSVWAEGMVMFVLGFWTYLFGNLALNLLFGPDMPREWMPPGGCVISAGSGQCVADFG